MPDRATISRVAKILARATSDSPAEADTALRSALARMRRDGVSFRDLLALPEEELYQATLVRLADLFVSEEPGLSPGERREAYKHYFELIVAKFSGAKSTTGTSEKSSTAGQGSDEDERDRMRREYERRAREEEATRGRGHRESGAGEGGGHGGGSGTRQSSNKEPGKGATGYPFAFDSGRYPIPFSPAAVFGFLFGERSFLRCLVAYPKLTVGLLFRSALWAAGITFGVIFGLMATRELWPGNVALVISRWMNQNLALCLVLVTFAAAYRGYERGWYPRVPDWGRTDSLSAAGGVTRFFRAVLWRYYGLWTRAMNWVYARYRAWRQSRGSAP